MVDDFGRYSAAALGEDVDAQSEQHPGLLWGQRLTNAGRVGTDQVHLQVSVGAGAERATVSDVITLCVHSYMANCLLLKKGTGIWQRKKRSQMLCIRTRNDSLSNMLPCFRAGVSRLRLRQFPNAMQRMCATIFEYLEYPEVCWLFAYTGFLMTGIVTYCILSCEMGTLANFPIPVVIPYTTVKEKTNICWLSRLLAGFPSHDPVPSDLYADKLIHGREAQSLLAGSI